MEGKGFRDGGDEGSDRMERRDGGDEGFRDGGFRSGGG